MVGSGFNYYPFDFMDGEEMVGFEVDVWNEIGERSGLEVEFMRADFAGLFGLLDKGDVDTIANQVAVTPEREEKYNFSVPYCYNAVKMIVPKGNPQNVQTTDDMIGKTVITGTGDNGFEWLEENFPNGEVNITTIQGGDMLQVVLMGKADIAIQSTAATAVSIKDNNLDLEIVGDSIIDETDSYPFAKTERGDALKEKVDAALTEMHEDGTLKELSEKWFGMDISVN